jgi:RNA polymerase sigma-70 factor, ECF subfamily
VTGPDVNEGRAGGDATSVGLLARVKAREQGSWEQLVALYTPLVYHWCRKARLAPADAAEDVGQEVFKAVFRKIGTFRREKAGDSFRAWLRAITQSKIIDHLRRKGAQPAGAGGSAALRLMEGVAAGQADDASATVAEDQAAGDERRLMFRQALKQLEPTFKKETWQAFWQVVAEGRTPAAVAGDLGVSVNTVYLAKSRVLRRFREEFADLLDPGPPA